MGNAFEQKYGAVQKSTPNPKRSGALLPKQVATDAAASAFIKMALIGDRSSITARDIHEASEVFDVYQRSNAIGDVCGHGRKCGGIGLKREQTGAFEVTAANLRRAAQALSEGALSKLLTDLEFADVDALSAKIDEFPNEEADADGSTGAGVAGGNSGGDDSSNTAVADDDEEDADAESAA